MAESGAARIEGCYTSRNISGRTIEKNIGLVQYTQKNIAGDVVKISDDIFQSLLKMAQAVGGNAVVNVRLVAGSYKPMASRFEQATYVIAYGDAVVLS